MPPAAHPVPEARPFFGRVESFRGLGALAVAGYHFAGATLNGAMLLPDARWPEAGPLQNGLRLLGAAAFAGHACLMAFFVISGFVLRVSLEHGPQRPVGATGRFLLSRVFRLYPIILFAVALAALTADRAVPAREVVANALLLDVSLNGAWWALQVELIMAPVIVALYFLERKYGPRSLVLVALVTSALVFKPSWALWHPLSANFFAFVLGMLIPTFGKRFVLGLSRRRAGLWLAFAAVAFLLPNPCFGRYSKFSTLAEGYAAFALLSLMAYRQDLFVLKWLDWKPLRLLGTASGSYYVLHMATLPLGLAAASLIPAAWFAAAPAPVGALVIIVWLAAIAPFTVVTYHLIEAPGIALGRRVVRLLGFDAKPAPIPVPAERAEPPRLAA